MPRTYHAPKPGKAPNPTHGSAIHQRRKLGHTPGTPVLHMAKKVPTSACDALGTLIEKLPKIQKIHFCQNHALWYVFWKPLVSRMPRIFFSWNWQLFDRFLGQKRFRAWLLHPKNLFWPKNRSDSDHFPKIKILGILLTKGFQKTYYKAWFWQKWNFWFFGNFSIHLPSVPQAGVRFGP